MIIAVSLLIVSNYVGHLENLVEDYLIDLLYYFDYCLSQLIFLTSCQFVGLNLYALSFIDSLFIVVMMVIHILFHFLLHRLLILVALRPLSLFLFHSQLIL